MLRRQPVSHGPEQCVETQERLPRLLVRTGRLGGQGCPGGCRGLTPARAVISRSLLEAWCFPVERIKQDVARRLCLPQGSPGQWVFEQGWLGPWRLLRRDQDSWRSAGQRQFEGGQPSQASCPHILEKG